jgi:hypothetical protein
MSTDRPAIRLTGGRRMQCKDVPDDAFLDAVRRTPGTAAMHWRMRWDVRNTLEAALGPIPINLFLAKARRLIARGLLGGCDCGCRGDYHLPDECNDPLCCDQEPAVTVAPVIYLDGQRVDGIAAISFDTEAVDVPLEPFTVPQRVSVTVPFRQEHPASCPPPPPNPFRIAARRWRINHTEQP